MLEPDTPTRVARPRGRAQVFFDFPMFGESSFAKVAGAAAAGLGACFGFFTSRLPRLRSLAITLIPICPRRRGGGEVASVPECPHREQASLALPSVVPKGADG